ncbi:autophagy-related protein 13-like [Rhopilema esculentum]|uniref:autophagy-related protein 13-like n=1 Tax=Rhopilema esculentum TaxID=499914 RepID=UPI0031D54803|eukprot:gene12290-2936_t
MAAAPKTERKEIEKYIKFFTYKALQTIVHSRSGEKTRTFSNANAVGVDWFNIALPGSNIGNEVQKEVKTEFNNKIAVIQEPLLLCVYLKTSEGFDSLLERWTLSFNQKQDPSVKSPIAVYNKLALLLKSLVSVTRSLPSYKLTRRKEKDFSFYYKILSKGSGDKGAALPTATKVGSVGTPFGSLTLKVQFQTKIDLYSQSRQANAVDFARQKVLIKMTKDDTFDSLGPLGPAEVEELRKAALDDIIGSTASLPTSFTNMSPKHFDISLMQQGISDLHFDDATELQAVGAVNNEHGAFAAFGHVSMEKSTPDLPDLPSTPPFLSFIQSKIDESTISQSSKNKEDKAAVPGNLGDDKASTNKEADGSFVSLDASDQSVEPTAQAVGFEDDFVLVEVRPAFAPQSGDAGQLYRECQNPPYLDMFNEKADYDSDNEGSITEHIEKFENQLAQYDEFFRNLEHLKVN